MPVFNLEIVTPEKMVYSGTVKSLQAPGTEGGFGVLARHAPMLASLDIGPLSFVEEGGSARRAAISGGFAEVRRDHVTVLAETAETAEEIDVERARAARDRAQERLRQWFKDIIDVERAQAALTRALIRLKVAGGN